MDGVTATPQCLRENRGVLRRVTLITAWGGGTRRLRPWVISVVLTLMSQGLGISAGWLGLIGASSVIGIFLWRRDSRLPDRPVRSSSDVHLSTPLQRDPGANRDVDVKGSRGVTAGWFKKPGSRR